MSTFNELFEGNKRFYGTCTPDPKSTDRKKYKAATVNKTLTGYNYEKHLEGVTGLGVCPLRDDNMCLFGALDIDNHASQIELDIATVSEKVATEKLPFLACRTRSGGIHLYVFLKTPTPAHVLRAYLKNAAVALGLSAQNIKNRNTVVPGIDDVEIFPKQEILTPEGGGGWLNLPYFGGESGGRYCWYRGNKLFFEQFVNLAASKKCDIINDVSTQITQGGAFIKEAPPCIAGMWGNGVHEGGRNEALYNFTLFAKKAEPQNYMNMCMDFNSSKLHPPLPFHEAKSVVKSAARRDYKYKCQLEPCKSLCNSAVCVTKKFGITPGEHGIQSDGTSMFTNLRKILTEPVKWELTVQDKKIIIPTEVLLDFRRLRVAIVETLTKVIPPLKNDTWNEILKPLMDEAQIVDAPKESTPSGAMWHRLMEFGQSADKSQAPAAALQTIATEYPAIVNIDGRKAVAFKGTAFIDWLRRRRLDDLKGSALWLALQSEGVKHTIIDVALDTPCEVWYFVPDWKTFNGPAKAKIEAEF